MAKRVQTRVGNVYCVEIDKCYKRYFQYICKDKSDLNGNVIRIFKKKYSLNENPSIEDIVSDEVTRYLETFIKVGVYFNTWNYVGKSNNLGLEDLSKIWFAFRLNLNYSISDERKKFDEGNAWVKRMWKVNQPIIDVPEIPRSNEYRIFYGGVASYITVLDHIKYGYSKTTNFLYDIVKRIPFDDVDSYTMRKSKDEIIYYHFTGENLMGIIIVDNTTGEKSVVERDNLPPAFYKLKFGDINWKREQFISEEDYKKITE